MAGITQTVPNYVGGISEQADQLKTPGQVKSILNGIPDLTYGLYKRPGTKRIGAAPLATNKYGTTNMATGGSWFHYYRDETEGAYLVHVDEGGKTRVWSCNDGSEKNVWYVTDNTVYNAGTAAHASITNYLTPSTVSGAAQTEDIQALTINDTTFLNNRSKTVQTEGTTDARPDTHWAYIELQRTENGRQYALNMNDGGNQTHTINRATRLKITSNGATANSGDGTGDCPGIGTQVWGQGASEVSSAPGGTNNLTFRITTQGNNGVSPNANADDAGIDGDGYRCAYSSTITLLHGGEGWVTGNSGTVTLDQAKTNYNYTVEVKDHEAVDVTVGGLGAAGAIRPAPTPFDADTAVTVDTILGSIVGAMPSSTTCKVIGNGIYVTRSAAFNLEVVDQDLMKVSTNEVNDLGDLPNQCKHGVIVKVAQSENSDQDDFYVKFKGDNDKDGPGSWIECPAPGIVKSLNGATMPHILQRQTDGDFLIKEYTWSDREVGDDVTNIKPKFVDQTINKVLFFRNRLVLLSGEYVVTSRAGALSNFWASTALAVSPVDPINISCSSSFPSDLYDGIEVTSGLLVFSSNQQFLFSSDDTVLNPDTAKLRSVSTYNYNKVMSPISMGTTIAYVDNSGKYSRFNEMANTRREGEPTVVEQSKVVPSLLPKSLNLLTNSRENSMVLFGKDTSDIVYGFKYLNVGDRRLQGSWFKWKFNNNLKYHFIIDDEYFMLDENFFLQKLSIIQQDADADIDENGVNYLVHLDNYTTITNGGTYNAVTKLTTFSNVTWIPSVTTPNGKLVLVDTDGTNTRIGRYAECTLLGNNPNDDFTVPGDWSGNIELHVGYLYDYQVDFPRIYVTQQSGDQVRADVNSSLVIHRLKLNFGKIGLYDTTLTRVGKTDYNEVYESTFADYYNISDAPYLAEEIKTIPVYEKNENVDITLKSSHPAPATLRSMSWEGDYSQKYYRRV